VCVSSNSPPTYAARLPRRRELEREKRLRLKEEEAARRELEQEQARLEKEKAHYEAAVRALQEKGDAEALARASTELATVQSALDGVTQRAANIRAGYVYVISNIGSFGDTIVKIGMTRRTGAHGARPRAQGTPRSPSGSTCTRSSSAMTP